MQDYKRIKAWEKAHRLLLNIHRAVRGFPREYVSLRSQLRRAAESVPVNIVEGSTRESQKEFASYLQTSISSSSEVEYWLRVAHDYGLLPQRVLEPLTADTIEVRKMLTSLRKKVLGRE
jgi:four helix bundle protein